MSSINPELNITLLNIQGNFLERIYNLEVAVQELQVAESPVIEELQKDDVRVIDLDLFPAAGITVTDPTSTEYIGGFICGEGLEFGADTWNFGGVNAGVIQVGINTSDGTLYAINANIAGIITVGAGSTAGGWVIDTSSIHDAASMVGLSSAVTGGNDLRIWAGNILPGISNFRVYEDGHVYTGDIDIGGAGTVSGDMTVSGTFRSAASPNARYELNATGFKQYDSGNVQRSQLLNDGSGWLGTSSVFSWTTAGVVSMNGSAIIGNSLDADKVSFTAPTISGLTFTNNSPSGGSVDWTDFKLTYQGTTYAVAAGNTASKYVYWKKSTSTTVLQTSATIPANGPDIFVVCMNSAGTAIQMNFTPFIYADYIFVGSLDAITVSTGALTVTGLLTMSSAAAGITIGATPPSSATVGTGLWIDRAGVYSLSSNTQNATLTSAGLSAAAGSLILDATGLKISQGAGTPNRIRFMDGATAIYSLYAQKSGSLVTGRITTTGIGSGAVLDVEVSESGQATAVFVMQAGLAGAPGMIILGNGENVDVNILGDTDSNLFYADASADFIGIGMNNPARKLDVTGTFGATGATVFGSTVSISGHLTIESVVSTGATGTNKLVFDTSPTLITPNLGTPTTLVLTAATGLPISTGITGLGVGIATWLATPSSANLLSAMTTKTGTGLNVFATSPTLTTPDIGAATGTSLFLAGGEFRSGAQSMATDTAISFTPNKVAGLIAIGTSATGYGGQLYYSTSASQAFLNSGGANLAAASGVLSGTTGAASRLTVSAHTDGKIYIENRSGGTRTVVWSLF